LKLRLHIIISSTILLGIIPFLSAQKIYFAPGYVNSSAGSSSDSSEILYSVYLLGDLKYPLPDNENLKLLKNHLSKESEKSAVVFLGDILYPLGLPDSTDKGFDEADKNLKHVLSTLDGFEGQVVFLPGNHDWARGRREGWENVNNQEEFIEQFLNRGNTWLPDDGCPGPVEIELTEDLTLIIFDSQWWFQQNEKPGKDGECDFVDEEDLFIQIEDALRRNSNKKVIFATHHPLYSVGRHGGHFPASQLLFPLLEVKNWMYLPLPGFLYTGYRKYLGSIQDLAHPQYKIFKETLLSIFQDYPNVIYAAGHEHNLQFFEKDSLHHIVSGGGGEGTYIARVPKKTDFAYQSSGFNRLDFYANGDVMMEFVSPGGTELGKVFFTHKLFNKPVFDPANEEAILSGLDFSDSVVTVKLSEIYNKGNFHRFLMGDNYRNVWNAEIELPVFDIGFEKGGLEIIKRGGGQQTRSIRMEDKDGKQYVLRSVNKYVEKALAENMRNTIAVDVLQDGISASHPFAALTVPGLADAAGVMHTNPKIVWVPDDPRLGIYRHDIANDVFLFEERPAGNREDIESFGRSEDIVNTAEVIKKTQKDQDYQVDQQAVVRARIFDILINDWDRHDDQWRWASFKKDKNTTYKPIPRDRDQVFFVNEGIGMKLATQKYPMRKFVGFDYEIDDVNGLTFNGRYFDRSFMTEPDMQDWMAIADDIKNSVTNSVIHQSISSLPENIYDSTGAVIEGKLQARRDLLPEYAKEYYLFLSQAVDVVGTKDRELFNVERQENGDTKVRVFALSDKKGKVKQQLYFREFKFDETKEVRLYGLSGKDSFVVEGTGNKGIKVRIIPGKGNDLIVDESKVKGLGKKTIVYDRKDKKNEIVKGSETKLQLSKKKTIDDYNRKQFKHDQNMPLLKVGYNIDDGIFVGGGLKINRYNFRDSTMHKISGTIAFRTLAFGIAYEGLFTSISQTFDLIIDANFSLPRNVDNYFGLGNQTVKLTDDKAYYRVRYAYAWANPMLKQTINKDFYYAFGPIYQYFKVTDTTGKFIGDYYPQYFDSSAYLPHHYTGMNAKFLLDNRDEEVLPKRGILWETEATGFYSIREDGRNFIKLRSDLRFYLSFRKDPRVVFAFRFGGAVNIGQYEFYHANFLGGKTNLRGFLSNRFAGDQSFYQNTEIRVKLLNVNSYIFNGQTGFLVFNDIGRVWVGGEDSDRWHDGYGIGVWLTPFDFAALTLTYSRSVEENLINFSFSFLF
jgi:hypothetical protein